MRLLRLYERHDAIGSVISVNLHRRHLTESQHAAVAAKLATLRKGSARTTLRKFAHLSRMTVHPKC